MRGGATRPHSHSVLLIKTNNYDYFPTLLTSTSQKERTLVWFLVLFPVESHSFA